MIFINNYIFSFKLKALIIYFSKNEITSRRNTKVHTVLKIKIFGFVKIYGTVNRYKDNKIGNVNFILCIYYNFCLVYKYCMSLLLILSSTIDALLDRG